MNNSVKIALKFEWFLAGRPSPSCGLFPVVPLKTVEHDRADWPGGSACSDRPPSDRGSHESQPGHSLSLSLSLSLSQSQTTRLAGRVWPEVWEAVIVHCYCSELVSSLRTGISSGVFMFIANLPLKPCFVPIVILCIHQYLCHCFCELSSGSFSKEINNEQERNK